jgi:hypothetical protein
MGRAPVTAVGAFDVFAGSVQGPMAFRPFNGSVKLALSDRPSIALAGLNVDHY